MDAAGVKVRATRDALRKRTANRRRVIFMQSTVAQGWHGWRGITRTSGCIRSAGCHHRVHGGAQGSCARHRDRTEIHRRPAADRLATLGFLFDGEPRDGHSENGVPGVYAAPPVKGYFFSSSSSSWRTAAAATESSSSRRRRRTPWVERPASRISLA